jgi:hypothetical protein
LRKAKEKGDKGEADDDDNSDNEDSSFSAGFGFQTGKKKFGGKKSFKLGQVSIF